MCSSSKTSEKTAQEEYELGVWCEEHNLKDLALVHFEQTLKRDSTYEGAHKKLGHVQMNGRWLNADEVKEAQGLIKYKGRWVTPEEKERKEALAATAGRGFVVGQEDEVAPRCLRGRTAPEEPGSRAKDAGDKRVNRRRSRPSGPG